MPPTMKRIAAELGVSVTTISKVLNHHADIGQATRARVLAARRGAGLPAQCRRAQPDAAPHPHARRHHSRPDALVLRRDRRRPRGGRQRPRLRAAAVLVRRGRRRRSAPRSRCCVRVRSTASCWPRPTRPATRALLRDLPALGTALVMIDRDDHPQRALPPRADRRREGRPAGDGASVGARSPRISRTSRDRRSCTRKRREEGYREAMTAAGMRSDHERDRRGRIHGSRRLSRDAAAAAARARGGRACLPSTIRRRSAR